jgi:AraC-like DNA-binding protein
MASETFLTSSRLIGLRLLGLYGIDTRRFAQQVGMPPIDAPAANTRMPSSLLDVAFERAAQIIPDPAFALRAGECWHPSDLGALGYAWLSSESLRTALSRLARFSKIMGNKATVSMVEHPDGVGFVYDPKRGDTLVGYLMGELYLSLVLAMCRTNSGADLAPGAVSLRRPLPANRQPYDDLFRCPIAFGAGRDVFVLPGAVADKLLPTSNHELATTFDAILTRQLAELGRGDLESRCKTWLLGELTSGEPSEEQLARAMGMSTRTLQRKLGERGLSYRSVLEKTRYELALRYLEDPGKTVTDITFLLGFSEQSAFSRAFKRWSGKAPTAHRDIGSRPT